MALTDTEQEALRRWYSQEELLREARRLAEGKDYLRLEDYLHKTCLLPLGRHDQLPDYLKTEEGAPLFPTNLDPRVDQEKWQDAIEVAWLVMKEEVGLSHDDVHRSVADAQEQDWQSFIESVERRKRERAGNEDNS